MNNDRQAAPRSMPGNTGIALEHQQPCGNEDESPVCVRYFIGIDTLHNGAVTGRQIIQGIDHMPIAYEAGKPTVYTPTPLSSQDAPTLDSLYPEMPNGIRYYISVEIWGNKGSYRHEVRQGIEPIYDLSGISALDERARNTGEMPLLSVWTLSSALAAQMTGRAIDKTALAVDKTARLGKQLRIPESVDMLTGAAEYAEKSLNWAPPPGSFMAAGKKIVPFVQLFFTTYDVGVAMDESLKQQSVRPIRKELVQQAANWAGVFMGAKMGAVIGLQIGSFFGPAGAVAGPIVGLIIGSGLGLLLGDGAGKEANALIDAAVVAPRPFRRESVPEMPLTMPRSSTYVHINYPLYQAVPRQPSPKEQSGTVKRIPLQENGEWSVPAESAGGYTLPPPPPQSQLFEQWVRQMPQQPHHELQQGYPR